MNFYGFFDLAEVITITNNDSTCQAHVDILDGERLKARKGRIYDDSDFCTVNDI